MATNALNVWQCKVCESARCSKCVRLGCTKGCTGKLIRSNVMWTKTSALACGRGCVGGKAHSTAVCKRKRRVGPIAVLGFVADLSRAGSVKLLETNLRKMVLVCLTVRASTGVVTAVFAVFGPFTPGTRVRTFPRLSHDDTFISAQLVEAVTTTGQHLVPEQAFVGIGPRMWAAVNDSPCAHYRWFAAHPKRIDLVGSLTVLKHAVPRDGSLVPCPPVYSHGDYDDICCAWCNKSYDNLQQYKDACAPDAT